MKKKKILHVLGGFNYGGAETFVINLYKNMNRENIQFDALIRENYNPQVDAFLSLGGNVIEVSPFPKKIIGNFIQCKDFFKMNANTYEAVHIHANALIYVLPILLAKHYGWKKIILHSHNTQTKGLAFIHKLNRVFLRYVDVKLACGEKAGEWMYGDQDFQIVHNGIAVRDYFYEEESAVKKRRELNISNKSFVVGHVGRFANQKNHKFLVKIYEAIMKQCEDSKLLLIGDGELRTEIEQYLQAKGLKNDTIILSNRNDINELLKVMDVFVFPSLYEGLSIALIEAQASGVRCVVSDTIDEKSVIGKNVFKLSINDSPEKWAEIALEKDEDNRSLNINQRILIQKGYSILDTAAQMMKIYG